MAQPRALGNLTSAPRFLAFLLTLIGATIVARQFLASPWLSFMAGFDIAAAIFLISCISLLGTREAAGRKAEPLRFLPYCFLKALAVIHRHQLLVRPELVEGLPL